MTLAWISHEVFEQMIAEARALDPLETGGVLLGWRDGGDLIVTGLIGPGPYALHGRHMFIPDHRWQLEKIRAAFARSAGDLDYLGDWHTHPSGLAEMSAQDDKTLARLTRKVSGALMVIAAGSGQAWSLGAWSQGKSRLFRPGPVAPHEVRLFTAPAGWPRASVADN